MMLVLQNIVDVSLCKQWYM